MFSPYFTFKDLITIFIFIIGLCLFVLFIPNMLGDSENYVIKDANLQIVGKSLKQFQPSKSGNTSCGTGNDSW